MEAVYIAFEAFKVVCEASLCLVRVVAIAPFA